MRKFIMDIKLYTFLSVLSVISTEGRLIHKNKTKSLEGIAAVNPISTIRLTRDIDNESLTGLSKEETVSEEFLQSYNKRLEKFSEHFPKYARIVRDSSETIQKKQPKIEVQNYKIANKHSIVLVKKPIPKFSDIDYEDDFQTKMSKAHSVFGDSGDHEDEDFNLDDYDFDVNHDEFLSGRKPLEPRTEVKNIKSMLAVRPELKIQAKIVDPKEHRAIKREEPAAKYPRKSPDCYDDVTTTTDASEESRESEEEYGNEGDSKEGNKARVRSIRSWDLGTYINNLGLQTSKIMNKFLTVLPMFPQVPKDKNENISS